MQRFFDWKRLAGLSIAVGLLFLSFYKIDTQQLWETLRGINFAYLVAAFGFSVLMNWAKGMRWREIMINTRRISKTRIFALFHVGQMINLSLPALTGQAGRIVMLSKQEGLSKTFCFTTVVVEVLFDGISLILLMYASSFLFDFPAWVKMAQIWAGVGVGTVLLVLTLILRNERSLSYFGKTRIRRKFPTLYSRLRRWASSFSAGLDSLKSVSQILKVSLYSTLVWILHVGVALTLILAFKIEVPAWAAVVIIVVNSLLLMFPLTPGNIGSFQWAVILAFKLFGVPKSEAVPFSLVMQFMDIAPVFLVGIIFLFSNQLRFRTLRKETVQEAREPEPIDTNPS